MGKIQPENDNQFEHILHSRNVSHKHSKAVQKLFDLLINFIPDAEQAARDGKNVIWTLGMGECPLVYASGAIPVSLTEIGRLGSQEAVTVAEEYFQMPNETCAMVKAVLGEYYLRKNTTVKRLMYSSALCEPFSETFEMIKPYGYDIHIIDLGFKPRGGEEKRYDRMRQFYWDEYTRAAEWISGKPVDKEKLKFELHRYNRIQRKVRTVMNLRRYHPTYVLTLPTMILLMGNAHYFGKPEEYEEMLDELIEELSALDKSAYNEPVVSLVWSGARGQEFNIFEAIDEAGGAVLGWSIPNDLEHTFDESIDPYESLIDLLMGDKYTGTTEDACIGIEEQAHACDAKGLILYTYLGCSFGTIDMELKRNFFKERDLPSIALIGAFQVGAPTGQVVTRVKAFIEMLS